MRLGEPRGEIAFSSENISFPEQVKEKVVDLKDAIKKTSSVQSRRMLLALSIGLGSILTAHSPALAEQVQTAVLAESETDLELSQEKIQELIETMNTTEDEAEFREAFSSYPENRNLWYKLTNKRSRTMFVNNILAIDLSDTLPYVKYLENEEKDITIIDDVKIARAVEEGNQLAIKFLDLLKKEDKTDEESDELEKLVEKMPDEWFFWGGGDEFVCRHFARKVSFEHRDNYPKSESPNEIYQIDPVSLKERCPINEVYDDLPNLNSKPDHVINGVFVGSNPEDPKDWLLFEPQTDDICGASGICSLEAGNIVCIMPLSEKPLDNDCDQGDIYQPESAFLVTFEGKLLSLPPEFTVSGLAAKIRSGTLENPEIALWNLNPSEENLKIISELAKVAKGAAYEIYQEAEEIFCINGNPEFSQLSRQAQYFVRAFSAHKETLKPGRELDFFLIIPAIKERFPGYIEGGQFLLDNAADLLITREEYLGSLRVMIDKMKNAPEEIIKKAAEVTEIL